MPLEVTIKGDEAKGLAMLEKMQRAMTPEAIDPMIEFVAAQTFAHVVEATPKKWFGSVRAAWQLEKPAVGERLVINRNKVMRFLEDGTANGGTGFIYPQVKKVLYIPLTRAAAGGWHEGLKNGVDYILRPKVKGIAPRKIVEAERLLVEERLKVATLAHLRQATQA